MAKYQSSACRIGSIPTAMFVSRVADLDISTRMDPLLIRSYQKPNKDPRLVEGKRIFSPNLEDYSDKNLVLSKASSQVCVSEMELAEISGK